MLQQKPIDRLTTNFVRPLTSVDVVIFAIFEEELKVLLVKRNNDKCEPFPGYWALPGGFINVEQDISLEACAIRKLEEKTGVKNAYLEQLGSWGSRTRDPRAWSATHAYFSLISTDRVEHIRFGANTIDVAWTRVVVDEVEEILAFDHNEIVTAAIARLRNKVEYTSLPAFLVAQEFTLSELQKAYEIVLNRKLEKSAFRTRVLATKLVVEVPRYREGSNRPAQLYKLRSRDQPVIFQRTFKPKSGD